MKIHAQIQPIHNQRRSNCRDPLTTRPHNHIPLSSNPGQTASHSGCLAWVFFYFVSSKFLPLLLQLYASIQILCYVLSICELILSFPSARLKTTICYVCAWAQCPDYDMKQSRDSTSQICFWESIFYAKTQNNENESSERKSK